MRQRFKVLSVLLSCILLSACNTATYKLEESLLKVHVPKNWENHVQLEDVKNGWLMQISNDQIQSLVQTALNNNFTLKQQAYSLQMKKQELIISGNTLWPSLDLALSSNRRKNISPNSYINNVSVDLNIKYEIDLWGKLSDFDKQANLSYLSD